MIQRALKLQEGINTHMQYAVHRSLRHLCPTHDEWQQLRYLSDLLAPYHEVTLSLSEQQGPTVHRVFKTYETLFGHLEYARQVLRRKQVDWKAKLCQGVDRAHEKLRSYYSQTYESQGYLYAIATILNPATKLHAFTTASWIEAGKDWAAHYREIFTKVFEYYANQNPHVNVRALPQHFTSRLDRASAQVRKKRRLNTIPEESHQFAELEVYFTEGESC